MSVAKRPTVGVSGKIGSGKTTLCDALIRRLGDAVSCNFADPLKREMAALYGIDVQRCYAQEEKNRPISDTEPLTIGEALQNVGALRRATNPSYWMDQLGDYVDSLGCKVVVVGDVRHTDEAEWVRARGGLLVRLNGDPGGVRAASKRDHTHRSETELDDYTGFDLVFDTETTSTEEIAREILGRLAQELQFSASVPLDELAWRTYTRDSAQREAYADLLRTSAEQKTPAEEQTPQAPAVGEQTTCGQPN